MGPATYQTLTAGGTIHRLYPFTSAATVNPTLLIPPRPPVGWFRPEEGNSPAPDPDILLANLPDIVVRFDRGLRHVFVNAAMERVSGRPAESFLGRTLAEINNPGDFNAVLEAHLRHVFATGEERRFDHADPRGAPCFATHLTPEFFSTGPDGPQTVGSVLVVSHDVTARHVAERERDRAFDELRLAHERLVALNVEKDAFLGMCSHDLRNPLADILTAAELLQKYPEEAEMVAEMSGVASRSAQFMLALVSNLLDVTAIEAGQFPLTLVPLDLHPLAAQVVEAHQARAAAKGVALYLSPRPAPTGPDTLTGVVDRHAFVQILDNLVSNALKFTPPGGGVHVRLDRRGADRLGVDVHDSGPGLKVADRDKLFGKFARLSAQPTGGERSCGLGLSIVKRLTESMGGQVWCESEPGLGASFRVELPVATAAGERVNHDEPASSQP